MPIRISAKSSPFSLQFLTDEWEMDVEAAADAVAGAQKGSGVQLAYFMSNQNCN